jgi:hypothetical protein
MSGAPAYPLLLLLLLLPDGPATYAGIRGDRPRYERDGALLDLDIRIPDDLANTWFWSGSFLVSEVWHIAIATITYGVPQVFELARQHDREIPPIQAQMARARARGAKRPSPPATPPVCVVRPLPSSPAAGPDQLTLW